MTKKPSASHASDSECIAALRAECEELRAQLDLYNLSPGAVHDLAVECEAIRANFIAGRDRADTAEARVKELEAALQTCEGIAVYHDGLTKEDLAGMLGDVARITATALARGAR